MNYSFSIKFKIFNEYSLSTKQEKIRKQLCNDFHLILKNSIAELNDKYKYLVRCEPSICSIDEKKQLRMCLNSFMNANTESQYIFFNQMNGIEFFTLQDMKLICKKIKQEIEEYLHYEIEAYLYIDIEDL